MIDDHQRWLETDGKQGVQIGSREELWGDLKFTGLNLNGVDLSLGILNGVEFTGSTLRGAWFVEAELDGAVFVDCDLTGGARFDGADLVLANFIAADCRGARFDGAETEETIWTEQDREAQRKIGDARIRAWLDNREKNRLTPEADRAGDENGNGLDESDPSAKPRERLGVWNRERNKPPSGLRL